MPWREICSMEEKTRFIAAVLTAEESMTELCAEFGISRKPATSGGRAIRRAGRAGSTNCRVRRGGCPGQ
jgi:transposase-like protein